MNQEVKYTYINPIRDENQILQFRRASELTDCVFAKLLAKVCVGMSEVEVQALLDDCVENTAQITEENISLAFSIIESGERTSLLHGRATDRILNNGEFVTIDFGLDYKEVRTDFTRTFVIGKADQHKKDVYSIVKKAYEKARNEICCGMTGIQADALARDLIAKEGYEFIHGLGHGLARRSKQNRSHIITDNILLNLDTKTVLNENMVFTIEPGIYLDGNFGVRIEDTVLLTKKGIERLTQFPYELIEV